jgi:hypothetical protein
MQNANFGTDLSDAQWVFLEPMLPQLAQTGKPRTPLRLIVNALLYIAKAGATGICCPTGLIRLNQGLQLVIRLERAQCLLMAQAGVPACLRPAGASSLSLWIWKFSVRLANGPRRNPVSLAPPTPLARRFSAAIALPKSCVRPHEGSESAVVRSWCLSNSYTPMARLHRLASTLAAPRCFTRHASSPRLTSRR